MGSTQHVVNVSELSFVPPDLAAAATRYQAFHEIEAEHLALMSRHDLSVEWTPGVRQIVFNAADHIRHARDARLGLRAEVLRYAHELRMTREPLEAAVRQTIVLLQLLEASGALRADGGWLEAEVLGWTIEEYENAA